MAHTRARILYVDAHQDTRVVMMLLLQQEGYGVVTAGTMAEGIEQARNIPFDLYMLETRLPDGTGVDLCERLHEVSPDTPVLYYTAEAYEKDKLKTLTKCGHEYLMKPMCFADIKEAVLRMLLLKEHQGSK